MRLHRHASFSFALLAVAALATALPQDVGAARGSIPVLQQITNNTIGTVEFPRIRMQQGLLVTFTSDGDVLVPGVSPGHREIYVYDRLSGTTTRATNTVGGESYYGSRSTDDVVNGGRPDVITFTSTGTHGAGTSNPEGNPEIFVYETMSGTVHQLTSTGAGVINDQAYPSDSGQCIVFQSSGDIDNNTGVHPGWPGTGFTNADGSAEVFMMTILNGDNYPDGFISQMSNGPAGTTSSYPVTGGYIWARQCQNTPYLSDHDQLGEGVTGEHIYIFKRQNFANARIINKSRNGLIGDGFIPSGTFGKPHISSVSPFARGPNVAFVTDSDPWLNGSGLEMFRYRVFHPQLQQNTLTVDGLVSNPTVSDGGGWFSYQSTGEMINPRRGAKNGDPGPFNADHNDEIFQIRTRKIVWQITRTEGCTNDVPHMNGSGEFMVFRSDCDLVPGSNPGGVQQVFLYSKLKRKDPLIEPGGTCLVEEGCCNEANGCFVELRGKQIRPPKRFTATR